MRAYAAVAVLSLLPAASAADKLTFENRVELTRGLMAEYAVAKVPLPRSRKPLEVNAATGMDKKDWASAARKSATVASVGDKVQVTKVDLESDRIVLQINGGYNGGRHWYRNLQIGGGTSSNPNMTPIGGGETTAPYGTSIALVFDKPLESIKTADVKKLLASVLDFDPHSVTEVYAETLPPEVQKAVKEKRALVGMDREQVVLALGRPNQKSRETKDGVEYEDWVYGQAPGKFTFVTFKGQKVVEVKEEYAGLGTQVTGPPQPPEE